MDAAIEGVLLAAGESRRMGYPKPLLKVGDEAFIARLCRLLLGELPAVVVVLGARADEVRHALAPDPRISFALNANYKEGQLSSLQAGLRAISATARAALVHLADTPLIDPSTIGHVLRRFERHGEPIVIPRFQGRRGHPVLFGRAVFEELLTAPPSAGAKAVVNRDPGRVGYVEVDDPGILADLDTPEDLSRAGLEPPHLR